jgi:hypothetical protein
MNLHRLAEERSIALHSAIAARLRRDQAIVERARVRVAGWRRDRSVSARWIDAWERALALPTDELCALLVDGSERARAMRQSTPFAGVIDPRTRWHIWREVRSRMAAAP